MVTLSAEHQKVLNVALGWRQVGNTPAAVMRLSSLRSDLRGLERQALDWELTKAGLLHRVCDEMAAGPLSRLPRWMPRAK
jgi:hypothetical protein